MLIVPWVWDEEENLSPWYMKEWNLRPSALQSDAVTTELRETQGELSILGSFM